MMLFAEQDASTVAGEVALYAAAATGTVAVIGALFGGLGSLLTVWYTNRGKVKADAILEYTALYDASRSEVHALRNDLSTARLDWEKQSALERANWQAKADETRIARDNQFAILTAEVFKLHDEHTKCVKESEELRGEMKLLRNQIDIHMNPKVGG